MRTVVRFATLLVPLVAVFVASSATASTSYSFNYTVMATGTQTVTTAPDQTFSWTIDGTATEFWHSTGSTTQTLTNGAFGSTGNDWETYHIIPPAGSTITGFSSSNASFTSDPPGNEGSVISATIRSPHGHFESGPFGGRFVNYPHSLEVVIDTGGASHKECVPFTSFCSMVPDVTGYFSIDYTIQYTTPEFSEVTASSSGIGSVNFNEGVKIVEATLPTFPTPHGGLILGGTYTISDDNPDIETTLSGSEIHASTNVIGTGTAPWSATETGTATVDEGQVDLLVATSSLVAPNGDTLWTVTDDHAQVETSMTGADVFATGLAAPSGAGTFFNYTVSATGTETANDYPDQPFNWTYTGTGTESWQELGQSWTTTAAGAGGVEFLSTIFETKEHVVPAPVPNGVITSFTRTSQTLDHAFIVDEFLLGGNLHVRVSYSGYAECVDLGFGNVSCLPVSATFSANYDLEGYVQHTDTLTVADGGSETVSAPELNKIIKSVNEIVPQNGGTLSGVTYEVTQDNPLVQIWKSGSDIVAATASFGPVTNAWSGSLSGAAMVSAAEGLKNLGPISLPSPNGDQTLSVGDDSPDVVTSLVGGVLYAQTENDGDGIGDSVDTDPGVFSNDFDDGTTTGSVLSRGDQTLEVTDAPNPADGVLVIALPGGGPAPAVVSVSGGAGTVVLDPGESVVLTTASADIEVLAGPVDATLVGVDGTTATVTIPAGNTLIFDPNTLTVTTPPDNPDVLVIVIEGEPGSPTHLLASDTTEVLPSVVPPVVTVPDDFAVEATSPTGALVEYVASAADDIDGPLPTVCVPPSGTELPLGVHMVTCEATDSSGLLGSASFNVTVEDTTAPEVTAPVPVVIEADLPNGASSAPLGVATATDLVDPAPTIASDAPVVIPLGDSTVTWSAEDFSGNIGTGTQLVTVICPAGSFLSASGDECTQAPPGTYVDAPGATEATLCELGTYQPLAGQISCVESPPGSYVDVVGAAEATLCAPGTFQSLTGQISCIDSPPGSFVNAPGAFAATPCAPGTYQPLAGQVSCVNSSPGSFVDTVGAVETIPCAPGTFQALAGQISCVDSPPGSFVDTIGAVEATPCAPGTFQPLVGQISCVDSPPGSFVNAPGAFAATPCAPGTYQPLAGQISCVNSPPGSFVDTIGAVEATPCAPGTFQSLAGQISCVDSPPGLFVDTIGAVEATPCAPGTFQSLAGQISCVDSPPGSFVSVPGATSATLCALGTFQSLPGQISCIDSPPGSFVGTIGAVEATPCAPGTFQSLSGQISCVDSPPGSFVSVLGATSATLCAPGAFQPLAGQISCVESPPGAFVEASGAAVATLCEPGTYQPLSGQTSCIAASPGTFVAVSGAVGPTPCALGTYQPGAGASACIEAPVGTYVDTIGATASISCPTGLTTLSTGSTLGSDCVDLVPPELSLPEDLTAEGNTTGGALVLLPTVTATDIVGPAPVVSCDAPSGFFPLGATTVTCSATDASGNSALGSFVVQVVDTMAPVLAPPSGLTIEGNVTGGSDFVPSGALASDVVDLAPIVTNDAPALFPLGTTLVTWTATDASGNATTAIQEVTVVDTTAPTLTVPGDITVEGNVSGGSDLVVSGASASDIVDSTPIITNDAPNVFPLGTTIVTWTATDSSGNSATATQSVAVVDTTPPVLTAPADVVVEANTTGGANLVLSEAAASDIVDASPVITNDAPALFPLGVTTVTWTATDASGNSTPAFQSVTVIDTTPPTLSVPADITAEGDTTGGAFMTVPPATATDIATPSPAVECDASSGLFPLGTTLVVCTATDASGNSSSATFTITVVDTTPPALTLPSDMTVLATGSPGSTVSFATTATDIVDPAPVVNCSPTSGSLFPIGSSSVTCSTTDASGNVGLASFTVTVLGGRSLVEASASALAPFGSEDERFRNALRDLQSALSPALWEDEVRPGQDHGQQVFSRIRSAIQDLESLLQNGTGSGKKSTPLSSSQLVAVEAAISNLLTSSRILASTAIDDAEGITPLSSHASELAQARAYFEDAEASSDPVDAVHYFRKAWEHARNALSS